MRDAFGGTMMIELLMIFIVVVVAFTAVLVNVAKTFRIKNEVINIIEQTHYNGGYSLDEVDTYIINAGYQTIESDSLYNTCISNSGNWGDKGYCITPIKSESSSYTTYYKVTVYVSVSFPFFDGQWTLPISGETKSYQNLT